MENILLAKKYRNPKLLLLLFLFLLIPSMGHAQFGNVKEKVQGHIDSDPLTIGGQLGGEMNMS